MKQKWYALYDEQDTLIFVGTTKECAEYLGKTINSFKSSISKIRKGKYRSLEGGLMAYELDNKDD